MGRPHDCVFGPEVEQVAISNARVSGVPILFYIFSKETRGNKKGGHFSLPGWFQVWQSPVKNLIAG